MLPQALLNVVSIAIAIVAHGQVHATCALQVAHKAKTCFSKKINSAQKLQARTRRVARKKPLQQQQRKAREKYCTIATSANALPLQLRFNII